MDNRSCNPAPPKQRRPDAPAPLAAHDEVAAGIIAHLFERQHKQQENNLMLLRGVPPEESTYAPGRNAYVGWIYQLSDKLKFGYDTGTSAVILADRTLLVLSRVERSLPQEGLELVCVACLLISAKMEEKEVDIPPVSYVLKKAGIQRQDAGTDVRRELQAMELIVLQASDWNACVVSPTHFIAYFVDTVVNKASSVYGARVTRKAAKASLALAVQISRLALDDAPLVTWIPSSLALGAVMLGFEIIQMPMWDHLDEIAEELGTEIEPGDSEFWLSSKRLRLLVDPLSRGALGSHPPLEPPAKSSTVSAIAAMTQKLKITQQEIVDDATRRAKFKSAGAFSQNLSTIETVPRTPAAISVKETGTECASTTGAAPSLLPLSPDSPTSPTFLAAFGQVEDVSRVASSRRDEPYLSKGGGGARAELRTSEFSRKEKGGSKPRIGLL